MQNTTLSPNISRIFRIAIGLIFGLIIGYLFDLDEKDTSNAQEIWRPTLIAIFVLSAFVFWAALGAMRRFSVLIWGIISMILIGIITHHAFFQSTQNSDFGSKNILWILPFLFITHELVSSGDQANKLIAPYQTYFDEAWKRGVQLFLALGFTIVFWLILVLGASLLKIIGQNWFSELIENRFFNVPATGIALASAVHLGDVQSKLLNNFRNLVLSVFSWLLPIIVLVAGIFAISLLFTGLKPLWETKAATASLLLACMFLVLLINAAYQDGNNIENMILKIAIRIASFETLIFAAIAIYSLWLRIDQYGLTHERILAGIGTIVALLFGIGYFASNFISEKNQEFMPKIREINIGMAFVKSTLFFAILTPIADPSRLSVNSQINMLLNGKTKFEKFDWYFLRYESGKYGLKALEELKKSNNPAIAAKALEISKKGDNERYDMEAIPKADMDKKVKINAQNLVLVTGSKAIPKSFFANEFHKIDYNTPTCMLGTKGEKCNVFVIDANNDGQDEVILSNGNYLSALFSFENNLWVRKDINFPSDVTNFEKDFNSGKIKTQKPVWNNIIIGDKLYEIRENQ